MIAENIVFDLGPAWLRAKSAFTSDEYPTIDLRAMLSYMVDKLSVEKNSEAGFSTACSEMAYTDLLAGAEPLDDHTRSITFEIVQDLFNEIYTVMKINNIYSNGIAPYFFRGLINGNSIILSLQPRHHNSEHQPMRSDVHASYSGSIRS